MIFTRCVFAPWIGPFLGTSCHFELFFTISVHIETNWKYFLHKIRSFPPNVCFSRVSFISIYYDSLRASVPFPQKQVQVNSGSEVECWKISFLIISYDVFSEAFVKNYYTSSVSDAYLFRFQRWFKIRSLANKTFNECHNCLPWS